MSGARIIRYGLRKHSTAAHGCMAMPTLNALDRMARAYLDLYRAGTLSRETIEEQAGEHDSAAARRALAVIDANGCLDDSRRPRGCE